MRDHEKVIDGSRSVYPEGAARLLDVFSAGGGNNNDLRSVYLSRRSLSHRGAGVDRFEYWKVSPKPVVGFMVFMLAIRRPGGLGIGQGEARQ